MTSASPLCPIFGECGGCLYQDIPYEDELARKEKTLRDILGKFLNLDEGIVAPIIASPQSYHYRNRLDLKLVRTKSHGVLIGFTPKTGRGILPIEACPIAAPAISEFIPKLKEAAPGRLQAKHRQANLVVRTGDDGRVRWGGIGRRSCVLVPEDYLWTQIQGKKIFYSLDTFFQANLSILPAIIDFIRSLDFWSPRSVLHDLYGGVGLFGISLADKVGKVILVEENPASVRLAHYNVAYNRLQNFEIAAGRVEDVLPALLGKNKEAAHQAAMVDPPRAGLSPSALSLLPAAYSFHHILYLSCNPEALGRDLSAFVQADWRIEKIIPFDFFPRTGHLETLALLRP